MGSVGPARAHALGARECVVTVPRPGQIYWVELGLSEPKRAIVVSQKEYNRGDYILTILTTSQKLDVRWRLPNCVAFRAGRYGFTRDCVAQAETITMTDKADLDLETGPIGELDAEALRDVIRAIGCVIGAEYEPS